ncbi:MAG: iron-containing alcohol dehydrogenase [Clostridia bacterium]|nr:iron-containing alcohol dehydrogenase [Clostridia bacterium]
MNYNEFSNGTKIIDSKNSIDEISTILVGLNASRVLLVGNTRLEYHGYIEKIKKSIEKQPRLSIGAVYMGDDLTDGENILKDLYFVYMSNNCDSIVVCGSGKLIDYTKALKLMISTQVKDVRKFYNSSMTAREIIYIPFIALPSEFGSGNETNSTAVIFDNEKGLSRNLVDGLLSPDYCLIDGELISYMDTKMTAYGILEIFARAIDGFTVTYATPNTIDAFADYIELQTSSISDGFCQVALTGLKRRALSLLEEPTVDRYRRMEIKSAYLSKGTDSSGQGLIQCAAQAIADVKGIEYHMALPKAIKAVFAYNVDSCKTKYARCLLSFAGWQIYSECKQEERHTLFVKLALDFIDLLADRYFAHDKVELNEEEKQAVLNAMAFNINVLNNPRKFNAVVFKTLL